MSPNTIQAQPGHAQSLARYRAKTHEVRLCSGETEEVEKPLKLSLGSTCPSRPNHELSAAKKIDMTF